MRPRTRTGGAAPLIRALLCALAVAGPPAAVRAAVPADYPLEFLQLGSRPDLGLGGDPFLSRLEGEAGWWRRPLLASDRAVSLRQIEASPVTRRLTDNRMLVDRSAIELIVQESWKDWGRGLQVQLAGTWGAVHNALRTDLSRVDMEETGAAYRGLVRVADVVPGLTLQTEFPLGGASSEFMETPLCFGLRYRFRNRVWVEAHRARSARSPSLVARLESERVASSLNVLAKDLEYGARIRIWRTLAVESRIRQSTVEPDRGLGGGPGYEFLPDGSGAFRQHEIGLGRDGGRRLLARYSRLKLRGSGQGFLGGQRYLLLNYGSMDLETWTLAGQLPVRASNRLILEFAHTQGDGFSRAKVESWPFLSWQESWLNGSKIAHVSADGRMQRYHVGYERTRAGGRLAAGMSWYEIHPNATVDSWTQVVLGKTDRVVTHLDTRRISLGAVSLGGSFVLRGIALDVGIRQFVYADDHVAHPPAGKTEPPPTVSGWFGGTYAEARLTYRP